MTVPSHHFDVLIVGSGLAGLSDGASDWAQGSMAEGGSFQSHVDDTLMAKVRRSPHISLLTQPSEGVPVKPAFIPICFSGMVLVAASGCTSQQFYHSGQVWQRNECNKITDHSEREHCMSKTNTSHEDYKRQTEDSKKQ